MTQLVLLSLFPTTRLIMLPMVIRASRSRDRDRPEPWPQQEACDSLLLTLFNGGEVDDPALVPQQLLLLVPQPLDTTQAP